MKNIESKNYLIYLTIEELRFLKEYAISRANALPVAYSEENWRRGLDCWEVASDALDESLFRSNPKWYPKDRKY